MPGPLSPMGPGPGRRRLQRILLADADMGVQATLSVILGRQFALLDACNIDEALVLSTRAVPNLLIVSASQPDLDPGFLVRALRAKVPSCPVLVVTDVNHLAAARELMPLGIDGYFVKPLRFDQLFAHIAALLGLHRPLALGPRLSSHVSDTIQYLSCPHPRFPTVKDLAGRAGVSVGYLSHVFSLTTRMPPKEYVMRVRIELAKRLLYRTTDKLDVIAAGLGFSDTSHLSRVFRARTGQTPGRFRRTHDIGA